MPSDRFQNNLVFHIRNIGKELIFVLKISHLRELIMFATNSVVLISVSLERNVIDL